MGERQINLILSIYFLFSFFVVFTTVFVVYTYLTTFKLTYSTRYAVGNEWILLS